MTIKEIEKEIIKKENHIGYSGARDAFIKAKKKPA